MFKLWARTTIKDKIINDTIYTSDEKFNVDNLLNYLTDVCYVFDIPTPVILKSHRENLDKFHITRFRKTDFIEPINFDALVIEHVPE